jgi:hypothetical protein
MCNYNLAWIGKCKNSNVEGESYCKEHLNKRCKCGKQATHECSIASSLVCGYPLCDICKCPLHEKE